MFDALKARLPSKQTVILTGIVTTLAVGFGYTYFGGEPVTNALPEGNIPPATGNLPTGDISVDPVNTNLVNNNSDTATIASAPDPDGRNRQCATVTQVLRPTNQIVFILASSLEGGDYPNTGEVIIYQDGQQIGGFDTRSGMPPNNFFGKPSEGLVACAQN